MILVVQEGSNVTFDTDLGLSSTRRSNIGDLATSTVCARVVTVSAA